MKECTLNIIKQNWVSIRKQILYFFGSPIEIISSSFTFSGSSNVLSTLNNIVEWPESTKWNFQISQPIPYFSNAFDRRHFIENKIIFHQNDSPFHKSVLTIIEWTELMYELHLIHQIWLLTITTFSHTWDNQDRDGKKSLQDHWKECIEVGKDYIEQKSRLHLESHIFNSFIIRFFLISLF